MKGHLRPTREQTCTRTRSRMEMRKPRLMPADPVHAKASGPSPQAFNVSTKLWASSTSRFKASLFGLKAQGSGF